MDECKNDWLVKRLGAHTRYILPTRGIGCVIESGFRGFATLQHSFHTFTEAMTTSTEGT